jgi:hypothetical protein
MAEPIGKRLEPMENSRSHLFRKCSAREPRTPTARGWFSRESTLGLQGSQHGHLSQFGELQQLVGGLAVEDTLTHVEQRILSLQ